MPFANPVLHRYCHYIPTDICLVEKSNMVPVMYGFTGDRTNLGYQPVETFAESYVNSLKDNRLIQTHTHGGYNYQLLEYACFRGTVTSMLLLKKISFQF